jgi:hypothetical protein
MLCAILLIPKSSLSTNIVDEKHTLGICLEFQLEFSPREIRLLPTHTSFLGGWNEGGDARGPVGRVIDPNRPDFGIVKRILNSCRQNHSSTCTPLYSKARSLPRLIDCNSKRIVQTLPNQPYICFSYVWGRNVTMEPVSHTSSPAFVPNAVEDAVFVAFKVGIPHLWVDKHCISQSNPE